MNTYGPEGLNSDFDLRRSYLAQGVAGLEKAMASDTILESRVSFCDSEMNLHVDLYGIDGIIPKNEVCYSPSGDKVKDIAIITRVGKPICFKISSIVEIDGRKVAYLSRRDAQIDCYNNYIYDMIPGDILSARVTHLESFGAFVDVGCGIVGLLPVDCISVSRFSHPRDRLRCGSIINVVLKSIDRESGRIFVSMRELLGTWEENAARFSSGQTVSGIIRSVESYGVFVELAPNLAGLAEIRDDAVDGSSLIGRRAAVYVKSIIPDRMKIKLVLIDTFESERDDARIEYFLDCRKIKHINNWKYSPKSCQRIVETVFDE